MKEKKILPKKISFFKKTKNIIMKERERFFIITIYLSFLKKENTNHSYLTLSHHIFLSSSFTFSLLKTFQHLLNLARKDSRIIALEHRPVITRATSLREP